MKQYRVLTQKDKVFGGKFDPQKLEGALNSFASEGWVLCAAATHRLHPGAYTQQFTLSRDGTGALLSVVRP